MKHFYYSLFFGILSTALTGQAQQLPPPVVTSLLPNAIVAGSAGFNLRVEGSRFTQSSRVVWRAGNVGATGLATTFISENLLAAVVPAGLLEQAGQIPLVVTQPGDFGTTLTSGEVIFTVVAGVTIPTACPLPNAITGRPYEAQFNPNGGLPPYVWSLASGNMPAGLSFSPSGAIRGTPTAAADVAFTVRVTDGQNNSASKPCSLRVVASTEGQSLFITQLDPPGALAGAATVQLRIRGDGFTNNSVVVWNAGSAVVTELSTRWEGDPRFINAVIPQNLLTNPGNFPIAVRGVVLTRQIFSNAENFVVAGPVQVTNSCPLRDGTLRGAYTEQLVASGGFPPYSWTTVAGSLPPGVALRSSGELSGAPTEAGVYDLSLIATDSRGNTATRACSLRVLGPLTAAPSAITFSGDAQGIPPAAQLLAVAGSASGLPFSVQAAVDAGAAWLRVSTDTTRMPALVRVTAEPGNLSPGVYRGSVLISTEAATNRSLTIPVTLVVGNAQNSGIVPRPLALRYAAGRGSGRVLWQAIQVTNPGSQPLDFVTDTTTAPWLTVMPDRGIVRNNQPAMVRVRASAEGLSPGTYRGAVRMTVAGRPPVLVPVTLSVSIAPEALIMAQSGVSFTAVQGGPAPAPRPIYTLSTGVNGYFWEATTATTASRAFVSVNPTSNASRPNSPSGTGVRVDPEGLAPDIYFGDVRVASSNTDNSPRLVSTVLQVLPPQANPPAELSFAGLVLTAPAGGATTTSQGLAVRNISRAPIVVDYQLVGDARIFTVSASGARTLGPGESRRIEVQANVLTVGAGVHRATLYIQSSSGEAQVRGVDVTLVATPTTIRCAPTRLLASPLTHTDGFQAAGGIPSSLEFRLFDDCGEALNSGVFMVTPSTNSGVIQMYPVGDGRWAGTWPVLQNTASTVTLNYFAEDPERSLQTTGAVSGAISATNVPVIAEDATLSSASFTRGAPLSPGGLFAIFGSQLAEGRNSAQSLPLPFSLGVTRVQAGDREIPLIFAGDQGTFAQVNAVMPYSVNINTLQQVAVGRGTRRSPYIDVAVAAAQPAIFSLSQAGGGQGIVVDGENPGVIVDAAHPIARGKIIVIYCEGLGAVFPPIIAGQAAPVNPLATVQSPVTVTVGGVNATVLFAGLTPGLSGLYQVNAVVPDSVLPGGAVPLVVTTAGASSEAVTIGVR